MSDYYDIDKPFSRENWNKLIQDINDNVENPPGECAALDPLEEIEENHIWTKRDVEDVREKLKEMCPDNEFEADLNKPWHIEIIDEIEDQMEWCDCGIEEWTMKSTYYALGSCTFDRIHCEDMTIPIRDVIDGMVVGKKNYKWQTYQVAIIAHSHENDAEIETAKAAYNETKGPSDPPWEATWEGSHLHTTWLSGNYLWFDGTIHTNSAVGWGTCEYIYINYPCIPNPEGPIEEDANEASKENAEATLAEYEADGRWQETVMRVFFYQAVRCEEGDPFYEPPEEE